MVAPGSQGGAGGVEHGGQLCAGIMWAAGAVGHAALLCLRSYYCSQRRSVPAPLLATAAKRGDEEEASGKGQRKTASGRRKAVGKKQTLKVLARQKGAGPQVRGAGGGRLASSPAALFLPRRREGRRAGARRCVLRLIGGSKPRALAVRVVLTPCWQRLVSSGLVLTSRPACQAQVAAESQALSGVKVHFAGYGGLKREEAHALVQRLGGEVFLGSTHPAITHYLAGEWRGGAGRGGGLGAGGRAGGWVHRRVGGWVRSAASPSSSASFPACCRHLHDWRSLAQPHSFCLCSISCRCPSWCDPCILTHLAMLPRPAHVPARPAGRRLQRCGQVAGQEPRGGGQGRGRPGLAGTLR